jgi:uncharacterized membrane protein YhhN
MKNSFLILFVLASSSTIISQALGLENLHHWSKPIIMLALGGYYITATSRGRSWAVLLAIVFSFFGDSFLLYEKKAPIYFMLGLGSFLLAHLIYIIAYKHHVDENNGDELMGVHRVRLAFPIVLAGSGLVIVLFPHLGDLKFPVTVYAVILVLMVLNALFRYNRTNMQSFWLVFAGAVLFMVSDSILALNKFLMTFPNAGIWIMLTYVSAQFLIVEGLIRHPVRKS